jgi:transposase
MSDEVGSAALSAGQKAVEVGAELIKLLAPLAQKMLSEVYHNSVDGLNNIGEKIYDIKSKGTVSNKGLLVEAQKAKSGISTTNNILAKDIDTYAAKAKQYNIPIAIIGNGEKQTIEFLNRDKGIIEQITQEIIQERLKEAPQSVKSFSVSENSVTAMKSAFEEHGIECQFLKSADGKIKCVYPAENAEQVAVVKEDYKQMHKEIAENIEIRNDENKITVYDKKLGKSFVFENTNKAQTMQILREQFGYSAAKSDLAANKICRDLRLDKEKFFSNSEQYDNINSLKTNIRYPSDDLTLREMQFNAVNFKDGGTTHIFIQNGDKTAALTPDKMTEADMKKIFINRLGMTENQAEKAVAKSQKINNQIKSQIEERAIDKGGISHSIRIERTSQNGFSVMNGGKSKFYNFSTINIEDKIARDFEIPKENARNVVEKAKNQSVIQNKINNAVKNKKPSIPETPKIKESKGLKR